MSMQMVDPSFVCVSPCLWYLLSTKILILFSTKMRTLTLLMCVNNFEAVNNETEG